MKKFILVAFSLLLAFDAVYLSIVGDIRYLMLFIPSALLLWLSTKVRKPEEKLFADDGLDLGYGIDIENPEQPKRIRVYLEKSAIYLGFLFIGGPGSGKTIAAINLLKYFTEKAKHGWIYFEGKGDLDIYQKNEACGNKPDKFFSSELPESDTTNIAAGDADDVIEMLTKTLIKSDNEFYRNEQREALSVTVNLLKSLDCEINLRDIYITLKIDEASVHVIKTAEEQGVARDTIETARQYFDQDFAKRMEYTKGLLTNMGRFVTGEVSERLNDYNPSLNLEDAAKNNLKVYMHFPLSELAKDIATMFTEQLGVIAKNRQLYEKDRTPWPALYDDWGAFFYNGFGAITARCRSAKIPCNFMFQSKGQTDKVEIGQAFTTEILDNIGGFIALKINGMFSANLASEQFGKYESTEMSSNSQYAGENVNVVDKPRVRADAFKDLDSGECYIDTVVTGEAGKSQNRRIRARFPFPEFSDFNAVEWPTIRHNRDTNLTGLNLWDTFMNQDRQKLTQERVTENEYKTFDSRSEENSSEIEYI